MKACVVVPTIREACIGEFLKAWESELAGASILVIEDNPRKSFHIPAGNVRHYAWDDIEATLGDDAWIIPRRSDCVRSFGYLLAAAEHPDMILTLDDDCFPDPEAPGFLASHWAALEGRGSEEAWESTLDGLAPRGIPYYRTLREAPVILNHGLWHGVPDLDAPTQLLGERIPLAPRHRSVTIPRGKFFPMCGMNLAWRPPATPALYFLLMGQDWGFDRFGDIWAGILLKRIADHLGWAVRSGAPAVVHRRASNVFANLRKEAPGLAWNEEFWLAVDRVPLHGADFAACYAELAAGLPLSGTYWDRLRDAMGRWLTVWERIAGARYEPMLVP